MILLFDAMSLITPDLGMVFWTTVIFLTFWFVVGKFALKPIAKAIKDREHSIDEALSAASKAKADIERLQSDNAALLKEAREEGARILKDAKEMKDNILAEAQEKAKAESSKIVASAKLEIDVQKKAALNEVKQEVSKIAVEMAEKILHKELDSAKDHQSHIQTLVEKINAN